ncbi:hypothetical protein BDF19DRAFT_445648, partial [Syncephalis fuscata]
MERDTGQNKLMMTDGRHRHDSPDEPIGGLATRRQQPRLYLPLNTSRVPTVPEAPGSPGILGSSVARRTMHDRTRSGPKSPLATPTALPPAAAGEMRSETPGKRHSQVAAWVAETRRVMNADWINRVSHGYGLTEEDTTPVAPSQNRPAISDAMFHRSTSSLSAVPLSSAPLDRKQLSAGNVPRYHTAKEQKPNIRPNTQSIFNVQSTSLVDNNQQDLEDGGDDNDEDQLQSLLSSVKDEDVLELSRMTRGHAEQRRANGMVNGSQGDASFLRLPDASLLEGRSLSETIRRARPVSPYTVSTEDKQDMHISDATWDRSERCKADLKGRYENMYAQMADSNYNPLNRIREQQGERMMHARAASWTGSPRSDQFPDSSRPLSPRLPTIPSPFDSHDGSQQMTPPIERTGHQVDTSLPFAAQHNSTVRQRHTDYHREAIPQIHYEDNDHDDTRSVTSDSHLLRRGRTIAKEIKNVWTQARLKNPLRKAISRKKRTSIGGDIESSTEHASNATTSNVDSASECDLSTVPERSTTNTNNSNHSNHTIATKHKSISQLNKHKLSSNELLEPPVKPSPKSLVDTRDVVESTLAQVARKALSDRQAPNFPRLQFMSADRRLSWNQALEAAIDPYAVPMSAKSLNDPEEFRKAVMSERVSRLFARFYERETHDNYFRMLRLVSIQDVLVELDITLLESQRKIFGEFGELVKQVQSDEDDIKEFNAHYSTIYRNDMKPLEYYINKNNTSLALARDKSNRSASVYTLIDRLNSRHADVHGQLHEVSDYRQRLTNHTRDAMSRINSLSQTSSLCFQQLNMLVDEHQRFITSHHSYWMDVFYLFVSYVLAGAAYGLWLIALLFIYIRRILSIPRNLLTPSTRRRS